MQTCLAMTLNGTLRLSDHSERRTVGCFGKFIEDNRAVFRRYFGVDLFAGSLNVDILNQPSLHANLDAGRLAPSFVIPKSELVNMPEYIGDGQAWECVLRGDKFGKPITCWIFRRKGSRVPEGVVEILAKDALVSTFALKNGDSVVIDLARPSG
jgi:CTP-dependent riboflavin kinase